MQNQEIACHLNIIVWTRLYRGKNPDMARLAVLWMLVLMASFIHGRKLFKKAEPDAMAKIRAAFVLLNNLVNSLETAKGTPFTKPISKPLPHHRVAIVGAGLAGLHMAYLLKKNNINNVVVLEKESRYGGKLMSVKHKGVVHEMGACYTSPDYVTNVYELAHELGIQDFVPLPVSDVWLDGMSEPMLATKYVIGSVMKLTGAKSPLQALEKIIDATYRYTIIHRRLFGKYEYDLMPKPSKKALSELNQTMMAFLAKHDLLALYPILIPFHTMQGYGHMDRISALYGMMWDTPLFLTGAIARSLQVSNGGCEMFRNGYMQLSDKLASKTDVRLGVNINEVHRHSNEITIKFNNATHRNAAEKFDFLIWAADARQALNVLDYTTSVEKSFSRLTNTWFTIRLYDTFEQCKSLSPIEYWLDNLSKKREHSVWARRNSEFVMTGERCNSGSNEASKRLTFVSYQMGDSNPAVCSSAKGKFQLFLKDMNAENVNIVKQKSWNYFPRYSVKDMADGILWKIVENQGERNTWFIGSSVSFESAKSVVSYNKLMLERMKM